MAGSTPNAASTSATNSAATNQNINALLQANRWNSTSLTYNFGLSASYYASNYLTGVDPDKVYDIPGTFSIVSQSLGNTIVWAHSQFSAVSNMNFTAVSNTGVSDLTYARADLPDFGGFGYGPGTSARAGDAWFDSLQTRFNNIVRGDAAWMLVLHELGHTLGLKHGHETGGVSNTTMTADRDSMEFSVMTYRKYVGADPAGNSGADVGSYSFAQSLMMYDIAALQHMYGADFTTNAGNTYYSFDPTTGEMYIDGVRQGAPGGNRIFLTIWDGNGIDTYNFSNYTTNQTIDLTPGGWSVLSYAQLAQLSVANNIYARGNVFNALQYQGDSRSLIENAIGGSGSDIIIGNQANNSLYGSAGNDYLVGATGTNYLDGGTGFDIAIENFSGGYTLRHTSQSGNGWTLTAANISDQMLFVEAASLNGVSIALRQSRSNFNFGATYYDTGATSDLILRDSSGNVLTWTMQNSGVVAGNYIAGGVGVTVVGTGDFNGDGNSEILLRNSSNAVFTWSVSNGAYSGGSVISTNSTGYGIIGTGDLNNNGTSDIVVQSGSTIAAWMMNNGVATGVLIGTAAGYAADAVGDINGDGSSDIIMHDASGTVVAWLLNSSGQIAAGVYLGNLAGYSIVGMADFNGDGTSDILIRQDGSGYLATLTMSNGAIAAATALSPDYGGTLVGTGDYNGDGTADIALQYGGTVIIWNISGGAYASYSVVATGLTGYTLFG